MKVSQQGAVKTGAQSTWDKYWASNLSVNQHSGSPERTQALNCIVHTFRALSCVLIQSISLAEWWEHSLDTGCREEDEEQEEEEEELSNPVFTVVVNGSQPPSSAATKQVANSRNGLSVSAETQLQLKKGHICPWKRIWGAVYWFLVTLHLQFSPQRSRPGLSSWTI